MTVSASAALDEERLEQRIREIAEAVYDARAGTGRNTAAREWLTRPAAAKALHVPLKRVRALVAAKAVKTRPRDPTTFDPANPKGARLEVFMPSLRAALEGEQSKPPTDARAWAAAKLARGGK